MQWISYRNFSYHHAIQFGPVERIATRFLPHNKRLDNMEAEFHLPCSQLLNLIFRSHKMKLSLIQKKGIQHIPIEKDTFNQITWLERNKSS